MRQTMNPAILMALGGLSFDAEHRDPFVCFADDVEGGYATEGELGYYQNGRWVPADYATVGAAMQQVQRPPAPTAARPGTTPMRINIPSLLRLPGGGGAPPRPAPGPSGLSEAQVRQIAQQVSLSEAHVRQIVEQMIAQMSPYGQVPSRVSPDEALFPMGLGFVILSGGPPLVRTGVLTATPQRAFRGERLVLDTFRSAGAVTIPVIVDSFKVGDYSQTVGGGALSTSTFASDSFGVRLMLDGAVPGVDYTVNMSVPVGIVIPAGETITIVGTVIGRTGEAAQR